LVSFKGAQFPKDVILYAVFFYVRYGVSSRDLEEIMEERGVDVDYATLNRWVIRYSPAIAVEAKSKKRTTNGPWRMDETYIKVKGEWAYLYRALDGTGDTLDFMLSEKRDEEAATQFVKQSINNNGFPGKVVMDKSGANYAGLANINLLLIIAGFSRIIMSRVQRLYDCHNVCDSLPPFRASTKPNMPLFS